MTDLLQSASAITTTVLTFGEGMVDDPRSGYPKTSPWTITVTEDAANNKLSFELIGVPDVSVNVGDEFDAYIVVEGKRYHKESCDLDTSLPMADIIRVRWDIFNGPSATVEVLDMHNNETFDVDAAIEDSTNNWLVWDHPEEMQYCTKVSGSGCDILRAKVNRQWSFWNEDEDVEFKNMSYPYSSGTTEVKLVTEHRSIYKEYPAVTYSWEDQGTSLSDCSIRFSSAGAVSPMTVMSLSLMLSFAATVLW